MSQNDSWNVSPCFYSDGSYSCFFVDVSESESGFENATSIETGMLLSPHPLTWNERSFYRGVNARLPSIFGVAAAALAQTAAQLSCQSLWNFKFSVLYGPYGSVLQQHHGA